MKIREMQLSRIPNTKELFRQVYERFQWENKESERFFTSERNPFNHLHCLILCTDWCPDVIWNVPVLFRILEYSRIPSDVLIMEDHMETMDLFLTDGGRAQPIAVFLHASTGKYSELGALDRRTSRTSWTSSRETTPINKLYPIKSNWTKRTRRSASSTMTVMNIRGS